MVCLRFSLVWLNLWILGRDIQHQSFKIPASPLFPHGYSSHLFISVSFDEIFSSHLRWIIPVPVDTLEQGPRKIVRSSECVGEVCLPGYVHWGNPDISVRLLVFSLGLVIIPGENSSSLLPQEWSPDCRLSVSTGNEYHSNSFRTESNKMFFAGRSILSLTLFRTTVPWWLKAEQLLASFIIVFKQCTPLLPAPTQGGPLPPCCPWCVTSSPSSG